MTRSGLRAAAFGVLTLALPVFAAPAAFADTPRILTVSGRGEASGVPDQAHLSAGVTTEARTAAAALSQNAVQMNGVFAALKKIGVADKKIQTSNFSVSPQYAPYNAGATEAPRITGYQVSNQVDVTLDDVAKVGPALDALVAAGANQINGVSFGLADPKAQLTEARTEAVADAVARAQTYAKAAGVSLGNIVSISDADVSVSPPMPMVRMAMAKDSATPVAAGEQTVSAGVTIVWEIR